MKIKLGPRKRLLVIKVILFVFAFAVAVMPTTVSRSREVNSRVIVEMIGIDCGDKISITAQYVMPTETEGGTSKDKVTVEGDTLPEAVEAMSTALGRRAELGHCSIVILGKDTTEQALASLMTSTDVTADVYLAAAEDKAEDLVGDLTDFMKKTGATDANFIAYGAKKSHVATTTLLGFLSDVESVSDTAYVPIIEMIESESSGGQSGGGSGSDGGGSSGGGSSGGDSSGGSGGGQKESIGMKVEKLALYGKDGRRGVLDTKAASGVAWVSSPLEKSILTANIAVDNETVENVSARLIKKSSSIKVHDDGKSATIKVKALIEPKGDNFSTVNEKGGNDIHVIVRHGFEETIKQEVIQGYADALSCNCDPLYLMRAFYRFKPSTIDNGLRLEDISVDVDVEVSLK